MQNYMVIDEMHLQTAYGIFAGVENITRFPEGELQSIRLSEKNMIVTEVGELVPAYTENEHRKNKPSVEFDRSGMVVSVLLEEQQEIQTPIGELPCEFVKFYHTGELHRMHIVDGQISGFWSEEDEKNRNIPLSFDLEFCTFTAKLNGICFYRSGAIKSITLYPGEVIEVDTPMGVVETGVGLSMYESGALKSVEPRQSVIVTTPIGKLTAYDGEQIGINADSNSLAFTEDGRIQSLITSDHSIYVQTELGELEKFSPQIKRHPLSDNAVYIEGMKITFDYDAEEIVIYEKRFSMNTCGFTIGFFKKPMQHCTPQDCASCSLCK